jgi:predicted KAP-like P-loop ATPase
LANALNRASVLEAKLKTTTKDLEEADKKRAKEVVATKLASDQAVKEVEARAIKVEKALAKVSQRQTQHEEAVAKRIDDLLTSFGSKYNLTLSSFVLLLSICILNGYSFVMQQSNLEKLIRLRASTTKDLLFYTVGILESN